MHDQRRSEPRIGIRRVGRFVATSWLLPGALLAGVAAPTRLGTGEASDDLQAKIQSQLAEAREKAGLPGVTAAVAMPDGRVIVAASGWADAAHQVPLTAASRMPAGSVGKTFVAAAILAAVDDKVLDLDSPIERWLGKEPWFGRLPNAKGLTLRLLLSHRSGVPEGYENDAFVKAVTTDVGRAWSPLDLLRFVFDKKPLSRPGTKYSYTDMNYVIAGVVFEHAVGQPLFSEIERRILTPLGLDDTLPLARQDWRAVVPGFLDPRDPIFAAAASNGETLRDGRFVFAVQAEYAGGGLISTSRDLARWAKQLWEGRIFSPPRLAEMLDAKPSEGGARYGLGVSVSQSNAGPVYGHDGWTPGYRTVVVYFPDLRLGAALQVNSDPMKKHKLEPNDCLSQILSIVVRTLRQSKPDGA